MKEIRQKIINKILKLTAYITGLIFISFAIVLFFAMLYKFYHIANPFKFSLNVFMDIGISGSEELNCQWLIIAEKFLKEIAVLVISVYWLSKFLDPVNPINFMHYIAYDKANGKYYIRYWIMLPRSQYMYDVNLRVFLIDETKLTAGRDKLISEYDVRVKEENLEMVRGVREATLILPEKDSSEMLIKKMKEQDKFVLYFVIKGSSENGKIYGKTIKYRCEDILEGCLFAPIQSQSFLPYQEGGKSFYRYHNFNKVYIPDDNKKYMLSERFENAYPQKKNPVISKDELEIGLYKGKGVSKLYDFLSQVYALYQNRFRWRWDK